jgi:cation diffusion facilitator family transporter
MREAEAFSCAVRRGPPPSVHERSVRAVVVLTAVTMVVEITAGYLTGSMALLADGWHMATHVGALGLASLAYLLARRYASHEGFAFGTGKVHALAGYTSAVLLGAVAVSMLVESVLRYVAPEPVDYAASLPVALLGLLVNLLSVSLLHGGTAQEPAAASGHAHGGHAHGEHMHGHAHGGQDHNHRAALMHVVADTLTSLLAIGALLAGQYLGWAWLDPASGIVGGIVVLKWGIDLCRHAGAELLDFEGSDLQGRVRQALEGLKDVRVRDLHVWSVGPGLRSCIVSLSTSEPRDVAHYHERLADLGLAHVTVEVHTCAPEPPPAGVPAARRTVGAPEPGSGQGLEPSRNHEEPERDAERR